MAQGVHHSFSNISADQTYRLDDVISELKRVRGCYFDAVKRDFELASNCLDQNQLIESYISFQSTGNFLEYQNAYVVAQKMKEKGQETIVLNPKRSLTDQVLALADPKDFPGAMLYPLSYKKKLEAK